MLEIALVLEAVLGKVCEPALIALWLLFSASVYIAMARGGPCPPGRSREAASW
jgi:hypothetical protein